MTRTIRKNSFFLHRWLGLTVGVLLCVAGLTGSILVFWHELDDWVLTRRFGSVVAAGERASIPAVLEMVQTRYAGRGLTLSSINLPESEVAPYTIGLVDAAEHWLDVLVNPYTNQIMGDRQWETSWVGRIYELHYQLLAGDIGLIIMGVVALLTLILSMTGIILWPGWRKLVAGFKIKWKAHPKRTNFDIHKVVGIITAIFLTLIGFTGFVWNIPQAKVEDAIYLATFTAKQPEPKSQAIAGQQPLSFDELLQRAEATSPQGRMTAITLATKPEEVFRVDKKQPQETGSWGETHVYLDQFSGAVLRVDDPFKHSRADAILHQFGPLHFGTFGGLFTRILYVFVGLAPAALMVTGLVMWRYRYHRPSASEPERKPLAVSSKS
jgi:uncharacterized iron-regulated membrane protein